MSADESLNRAEELLARLESTRGELERLANEENAEAAIDVLNELSEIAREVEAELEAEHGLALSALGLLGRLAAAEDRIVRLFII